ncbi:fatty acyl-AMP ligase [Aureimonas psammosilenae]|uniref:fatty acyl-AMP ligase n=1 Tax=Aureimonas psammosilenae TaxID=2495496 RepID=UPI001F189630|nr:fatty acyl-AMP ligase [Aureimonas psammosilenae]
MPSSMIHSNETMIDAKRVAASRASTLIGALREAAATGEGFRFYSGKGEALETLSYADLEREATAIAHRLMALGLQRGARVAILAETDGDFPRAFFACRLAGLVPAPMPLPAAFGGRDTYLAHLRRMVEAAGASAAIGPQSLADWLVDAVAGLDLAYAGTLEGLPVAGGQGELPEARPDDLSYLQFSSGSTRFPVGVAVTERALMANLRAIVDHGLQVVEGDRCVSWLPFYHDMGLVGFLLAPLAGRLSVDYLATRDFARRPLLWLDLISRHRATISYAPSFGYDLCVRRAGAQVPAGLDLSSWRVAGIGGDMIRPQVLSAFADRFASAGFGHDRFVPSYGMAETTLALSFAPLGQPLRTENLDSRALETQGRAVAALPDAPSRTFVSCGRVLPDHEIAVLSESGEPLGERMVGRLLARGPSMMEGYFRDQASTQAVLSPDGWLDTGDLGYRVDGEIVVTGRAKDLIIVNGRNIWPQDLELTAEAEVPGLRAGDVAAFSLDRGGEERVVAMVECRLSDETARADFAQAVEKALRTRHGLEVHVALVRPHTLPQTSSGKLSRTKARELYRRMLDEAAQPAA